MFSTTFFPIGLSERRLEPERMDAPNLDRECHIQALKGLKRVNAWSQSLRILWKPIQDLALEKASKPLRILDLATGGGDTPIGLWQRATQFGLPIEIDGSDRSLAAVDWAQARAETRRVRVKFFQLNVLSEPIPSGYDVITTSLFLHHLDEDQAIFLLGRMAEATRQMVLVSDLVRSAAGFALALAGTRILTRSEIVHTDALLSVRAAFTMDEVRRLASQAGLTDCRLNRHWPFRFLLKWRKE